MSASTPPVTVRSSLFNLLPALYRLRDAQLAASAGYEMGPLQSLLSVVEEQIAIVEENIAQLYDDLFIETCAPWVVPYIGDLIGYKQINGIASAVDSPRAEVANTIGFRRRKGTVPVLEQLARDATDWGAHAVEFFEVLATTQCVRNHIRPQNYYAPNLRSWKPREFMDTGFDKTAHKVDVRRIPAAPNEDPLPGGLGRYNVQNIGIFLWSLNAYTLTKVPATAVTGSSQCFRFSTLGADMPLFHQATELPEETTTLVGPSNVPDRLTRHQLCQDIRAITNTGALPVYYGPGLSLAVYSDGSLQDASRILVTDLSGDDGSWANLSHLSDLTNLPAGANTIAVDPRLGRIAIPPPAAGATPSLSTFCCYGFNAAVGGGEYPRASTFTASPEQAIVRVPGDYASIQDALAALSGDGVVEVSDSGVYREPAGLEVSVRANGHIELRAADGSRPTLMLGETISVTGGSGGQFNLNGFLITYGQAASKPPAALLCSPGIKANELANFGITHCTFVPGWALESNGEPKTGPSGELTYTGPAVLVDSSGLVVTIAQSILGPLYLGHHPRRKRPYGGRHRRLDRHRHQCARCLRRAHDERLHHHRQGLRLAAQPSERLHFPLRAHRGRYLFDAAALECAALVSAPPARLRALQLRSRRGHPAPPVPVRGAGARHACSDVLLAPIRQPRIRQTAAHNRLVPPRGRGRRRRDGRLPFRSRAAARSRSPHPPR
jgi:hypothetical protein